MSMTSAYGPAEDHREMIAFLRGAIEPGVTLFDTAEAYGPFANEELVGEALAPVRNQVVFATRIGFDIDPPSNSASSRQFPGFRLVAMFPELRLHIPADRFQISAVADL